jgi:repressor LexA
MLLYAMSQSPLAPKDLEALRHIRNAIVQSGASPSVRELQDLLGYRSPRSAAVVLERLIKAGFLRRRPDGQLQLLRELPDDRAHARTVNVPLVGSAPCGAPLLAVENIECWIPVSIRLARPPHRHFLVRAVGDSMNLAGIEDGDLVLVRQQPRAESGERVVALIDEEATIKVFRRAGETVLLEPRSKNKQHRPIVLSTDFHVQGVVVATITGHLEEREL